jgi:streptogramin lyase
MRKQSQQITDFVAVIFVVVSFIGTGRAALAGEHAILTFAGSGVAGFSGDGGPADKAQLNNPYGIARDQEGALYICDMGNHRIRRVAKDGTITTIAGTGRPGYAGDGGPALQADLNEPYEIQFGKDANMIFVEMRNHLVRRVDEKTRIISTAAGNGSEGFSGDGGLATKAQLKQPHSIQFDSAGDLYICDIGNHRVRTVNMKTGIISTFSGTGQRSSTPDGAMFVSTPLNGPRAIDFDRAGNIWLALREGNAIYKLDMKAGTIHHVAGTGLQGFDGNGGPAKQATLSGPKGISVGPDGNVYFADTESHTIRMIDVRKGTVELVAGTGERGDGPDGDPLRCKFARPHGVLVAADGTIFVGDSENHRVRVIR